MRKRTYKLQVWLSEHEAYLLKRKSENCNQTNSTFIRSLINDFVPREAPPFDYYRMLTELRRIGGNLNQIAHRAHVSGDIDSARYAENTERLTVLADELMSVFLPKKR